MVHLSTEHLQTCVQLAQSRIHLALFLLNFLQLLAQFCDTALVESEGLQLLLGRFCIATHVLYELSEQSRSGIQIRALGTLHKGRIQLGIEFPLNHVLVLSDANGVERLFFGIQAALSLRQFGLQFRELLLFRIRFRSQQLVVGFHLAD